MSGKNPGWKKIIDDQWRATGGGFNYWITFYRHESRPKRQIEIWQEDNRGRRGAVGLNIGTRNDASREKFDPIQGDYDIVKSFPNLQQAIIFATVYMNRNPNGGRPTGVAGWNKRNGGRK